MKQLLFAVLLFTTAASGQDQRAAKSKDDLQLTPLEAAEYRVLVVELDNLIKHVNLLELQAALQQQAIWRKEQEILKAHQVEPGVNAKIDLQEKRIVLLPPVAAPLPSARPAGPKSSSPKQPEASR